MKPLLSLACALSLAGAPAALAQESAPSERGPDQNSELQEGAELLSQGFGLILRGLSQELEPLQEGWVELMALIGDMSLYEAPEVLPNGDILIRRKHPAEVPQPAPTPGETEL